MVHQIPNAITVIRIGLIVPIAILLWTSDYVGVLILMAIAAGSDALDGALARRYSWTSRMGALADPLADKLLVGVTLVIFTIQGHVPLWLAVIAITRDLIILVGALVYRLLFDKIDIHPTFVSKANMAFQITMLIMVLGQLVGLEPLSSIAVAVLDPWGFTLVAVLGLTSGIDYVITWSYRAIKGWKQRSAG
jgi:cardiolipin synthase